MISVTHKPDSMAKGRIIVEVCVVIDGVDWKINNSVRTGKNADDSMYLEAPRLFAKLIRRLKAV